MKEQKLYDACSVLYAIYCMYLYSLQLQVCIGTKCVDSHVPKKQSTFLCLSIYYCYDYALRLITNTFRYDMTMTLNLRVLRGEARRGQRQQNTQNQNRTGPDQRPNKTRLAKILPDEQAVIKLSGSGLKSEVDWNWNWKRTVVGDGDACCSFTININAMQGPYQYMQYKVQCMVYWLGLALVPFV